MPIELNLMQLNLTLRNLKLSMPYFQPRIKTISGLERARTFGRRTDRRKKNVSFG